MKSKERVFMENKMSACKACGHEIAKSAKVCPQCGAKNKKPIFTKWWFWLIIVMVVGAAIGAGGETDTNSKSENETETNSQNTSVNAVASIS